MATAELGAPGPVRRRIGSGSGSPRVAPDLRPPSIGSIRGLASVGLAFMAGQQADDSIFRLGQFLHQPRSNLAQLIREGQLSFQYLASCPPLAVLAAEPGRAPFVARLSNGRRWRRVGLLVETTNKGAKRHPFGPNRRRLRAAK